MSSTVDTSGITKAVQTATTLSKSTRISVINGKLTIYRTKTITVLGIVNHLTPEEKADCRNLLLEKLKLIHELSEVDLELAEREGIDI